MSFPLWLWLSTITNEYMIHDVIATDLHVPKWLAAYRAGIIVAGIVLETAWKTLLSYLKIVHSV